MVIQGISFNILDVGKLVKKTKKRFIWKFSIDGVENTVEMVASYISGKKKVIHNGAILYQGKKKLGNSFQFPFQIDVNMCNIIQKGDGYEFRINNLPFDQICGKALSPEKPTKSMNSRNTISQPPSAIDDARNRSKTTQNSSSLYKVDFPGIDKVRGGGIQRPEEAPKSMAYSYPRKPQNHAEDDDFGLAGTQSYNPSFKQNDFGFTENKPVSKPIQQDPFANQFGSVRNSQQSAFDQFDFKQQNTYTTNQQNTYATNQNLRSSYKQDDFSNFGDFDNQQTSYQYPQSNNTRTNMSSSAVNYSARSSQPQNNTGYGDTMNYSQSIGNSMNTSSPAKNSGFNNGFNQSPPYSDQKMGTNYTANNYYASPGGRSTDYGSNFNSTGDFNAGAGNSGAYWGNQVQNNYQQAHTAHTAYTTHTNHHYQNNTGSNDVRTPFDDFE